MLEAAAGCSPQGDGDTNGSTMTDGAYGAETVPTADWQGAAPTIAEADVVGAVDTEALVVGAGCSGTFAVCFAVDVGTKTLLIESGANGMGIRGLALGATGTRYQKEKTIWDSKWKDDVQRFLTTGCSMLLSREGSNHHPSDHRQ